MKAIRTLQLLGSQPRVAFSIKVPGKKNCFGVKTNTMGVVAYRPSLSAEELFHFCESVLLVTQG